MISTLELVKRLRPTLKDAETDENVETERKIQKKVSFLLCVHRTLWLSKTYMYVS